MSVKKKPLIVVTRKLPDSIETRMRELFDAQLNLDDAPLTPEQLADAVRTRAGKSALHVTEHFTFDQLGGECATVDDPEWPAAPRGRVVNFARQYGLSRARLPRQEDCGVLAGRPAGPGTRAWPAWDLTNHCWRSLQSTELVRPLPRRWMPTMAGLVQKPHQLSGIRWKAQQIDRSLVQETARVPHSSRIAAHDCGCRTRTCGRLTQELPDLASVEVRGQVNEDEDDVLPLQP